MFFLFTLLLPYICACATLCSSFQFLWMCLLQDNMSHDSAFCRLLASLALVLLSAKLLLIGFKTRRLINSTVVRAQCLGSYFILVYLSLILISPNIFMNFVAHEGLCEYIFRMSVLLLILVVSLHCGSWRPSFDRIFIILLNDDNSLMLPMTPSPYFIAQFDSILFISYRSLWFYDFMLLFELTTVVMLH